MLAARGPRRDSILAIRTPILGERVRIMAIQAQPRARSARSSQTLGACTICTVMSGSGAGIGIRRGIMGRGQIRIGGNGVGRPGSPE